MFENTGLKEMTDKVSDDITVYARGGKFNIKTQGGAVEPMYFNTYVGEYASAFVPVQDICEIGNEFVTAEELRTMVEDTETYFVPYQNNNRSVMMFHRQDMIEEINSAISCVKAKNKARKWVKFNEVFPTISDRDSNNYVHMLEWDDNNSPFKVQHRRDRGQWESIPRFALSGDIAERVPKVFVPPPRVVFKLGKTREELKGYWSKMNSILNGKLHAIESPMRITNDNHHNIAVAIKYCKRQLGITIDDVLKNSWCRDGEHKEDHRIMKALYRSPNKYLLYTDAELLARQVERAEQIAARAKWNKEWEDERAERVKAEEKRQAEWEAKRLENLAESDRKVELAKETEKDS
jgi:hypothetical protein